MSVMEKESMHSKEWKQTKSCCVCGRVSHVSVKKLQEWPQWKDRSVKCFLTCSISSSLALSGHMVSFAILGLQRGSMNLFLNIFTCILGKKILPQLMFFTVKTLTISTLVGSLQRQSCWDDLIT